MVSKMYAQHAETRILEILWRQTYYGHGISSSEIHHELEIHMGAEAPSERTVRNQLNALEGESFLGRRIGKLTRDEAVDSGCLDPQPGWYLDAFLSAAEVRMLADSLTLSRISHDALEDLVGKLREVTGDASLGIEYLANVRTVDDYNGQFLSTIERLNQAIEQHNTVKFKYLDYARDGQLVTRTTKDGAERWYTVDPYQMAFKNGKYYLVCHRHGDGYLRVYYIDRLEDVTITGQPLQLVSPNRLAGQAENEPFDVVRYLRERPYPVTDQVEPIVMRAKRSMFDAIFEWFDEPEISEVADDDGYYTVKVYSPALAVLWWALQYTNMGLEILEPESLRRTLADSGRRLIDVYGESDGSRQEEDLLNRFAYKG